jgi:hypothetical protein
MFLYWKIFTDFLELMKFRTFLTVVPEPGVWAYDTMNMLGGPRVGMGVVGKGNVSVPHLNLISVVWIRVPQ